jgi:hypothetical protein
MCLPSRVSSNSLTTFAANAASITLTRAAASARSASRFIASSARVSTIGVYTQVPGSNPNAAKTCEILDPWLLQGDPPPNTAAFYLTTGNGLGGENTLGVDSDGFERVNANPCP